MLKNVPPSLINKILLFKLLRTCLNFKCSSLFTYKSIQSSWLYTVAKIGSKIVCFFLLVACMFRHASTSTHLSELRITTAVIFQPNS